MFPYDEPGPDSPPRNGAAGVLRVIRPLRQGLRCVPVDQPRATRPPEAQLRPVHAWLGSRFVGTSVPTDSVQRSAHPWWARPIAEPIFPPNARKHLHPRPRSHRNHPRIFILRAPAQRRNKTGDAKANERTVRPSRPRSPNELERGSAPLACTNARAVAHFVAPGPGRPDDALRSPI